MVKTSPLELIVTNMKSRWPQPMFFMENNYQWFNGHCSVVFVIVSPPVWLWGITCSCDCNVHRARRLWMTLVRSRQSMQLLRNVPSWFDSTFPSASTRKYLHPHTHHYFWSVWRDTLIHTQCEKHTDPNSSCISATMSNKICSRCHLIRLHSLWKSNAMYLQKVKQVFSK